MPENPAGLGYKEEKIVHFQKNISVAEKCRDCNGYKTEEKTFCPRCIARGRAERLQETEIVFYCLECCFRCLPGAYALYRATAMRFLCSCQKLIAQGFKEPAITKLI
ncbi:MAG: hypothetical protein A2359_04965 [Candidatus Moranbacteria bacterium RIFOXYB1_FULL_43_19]|nr:MAG: hypothetical protein A2359_04965 [Candidatus Moranbacteria bacterium RIFOXYB1_FULL_43_19]OGI33604.1 MAG: hypothetical protein A2420_00595 [Candidatus Moranbacteria bacterium RIFOXYC1_FULL_44_13]OGI37149.1 MAG: hypothetical protein A2612_00130 [Candidatus Moranbacteria bacterium RIFOXYD1_FULL_44_12]